MHWRIKDKIKKIKLSTKVEILFLLKNLFFKKSGYNSNFKNLSKALRFKYKACQICSSSGYLCVHHKDKDKRNDKLSNLIVLCFECHKKEHPNLVIPYNAK